MKTNRKSIRLTDSERHIIIERRERIASSAALKKFQEKVISTTNRWVRWSKKSGYALTLSTFVDGFNYQGEDSERMYCAVRLILSTMQSINILGEIEVINEFK